MSNIHKPGLDSHVMPYSPNAEKVLPRSCYLASNDKHLKKLIGYVTECEEIHVGVTVGSVSFFEWYMNLTYTLYISVKSSRFSSANQDFGWYSVFSLYVL